ncbi:MAG: DUF262 domain-containing protein [Hyphomicrobium sp.]
MSEFLVAKVLTLQELLSGEFRFELPWFQRAYAWTTEEAGRLLRHVVDAAKGAGPGRPYPLGTIVVARQPGEKATQLIDGQQRILTLTILFAVLRDMETDAERRQTIDRLVSDRDPRITPQVGCVDCLRGYVQVPGATARDRDVDAEELSESENNIIDNRDRFKVILSEAGFDLEARRRLVRHLAERCYVAVHEFTDADVAWLSLQREEETQHKFNATDSAKVSLTLAMPAADRLPCSQIWDKCEYDLGARDFLALLGHVRLIRRRTLLNKPLEQELARAFSLNKGGLDFMRTTLEPAARRLVTLRQGGIGAAALRAEVTRHTDRMSMIDDQIWVSPALHWLSKRGDGGETALFFKRLERLVWCLRLTGTEAPNRTSRMIDVLADIDGDAGVDSFESLRVEKGLLIGVHTLLRQEQIDRRKFIRNLLYLISSVMGFDVDKALIEQASLEHILPRGKKLKGTWEADFPSKLSKVHAHCLGNLTLLTVAENHIVDNKAWIDKRLAYSNSKFGLSREVAKLDRWTPAAVTARTERLIKVLFDYWDLAA